MMSLIYNLKLNQRCKLVMKIEQPDIPRMDCFQMLSPSANIKGIATTQKSHPIREKDKSACHNAPVGN